MRISKWAGATAVAGIVGLIVFGAARSDDRGASKGDDQSEQARIRIGYDIAPVALDLRGKNRALVGLGSYIMNAQGGCNDCHTHPAYAPGGDPFLGQPEKINSEQYLTGGR